jgi:hypothetical protein
MTIGGFSRGGNSPADAASCFLRMRPEIVSRPWPENMPHPTPFSATPLSL